MKGIQIIEILATEERTTFSFIVLPILIISLVWYSINVYSRHGDQNHYLVPCDTVQSAVIVSTSIIPHSRLKSDLKVFFLLFFLLLPCPAPNTKNFKKTRMEVMYQPKHQLLVVAFKKHIFNRSGSY